MKLHKQLFFTLLPTMLISSSVLPSVASARTLLAMNDTAATKRLVNMENHQASASARMGLAVANADKEITRRLTGLNHLITKINAMQRLSTDQKAALVTQVQTAITDLTNLKTKIDADTDPATLKADKQSIVTTYRIYAVLMPQIEIMAHADSLLQLQAQMMANNATIQNKITAEQGLGKDVTALNALYSDRLAKLADAQNQTQDALNAVSGLTPSGYPNNKVSLKSASMMLKTARQDLSASYQDLVKIDQAVAAFK